MCTTISHNIKTADRWSEYWSFCYNTFSALIHAGVTLINATRETLFQSQNTHTFSSFYLVPLRIATEDHLPPSYSIHIYPHVSHQTSAGPPSLHLWSQSFPPARLLLFRPTVTKSFFSISIIPSICMSKQSQTSLSNFVSKLLNLIWNLPHSQQKHFQLCHLLLGLLSFCHPPSL